MSCCVSDYFREPGCCNFTIKANVAWHPNATAFQDDAGLIPLDLTGYTPKMEIRDPQTKALIMTVTTAIPAPTTGQITLSLTDMQTETLGAQNPMPAMMYDLNVYNNAIPDSACILSGAINMDPGFTQP